MRNLFGWIVCLFKGHDWKVDNKFVFDGGHKIEWKSCQRCSADLGYRDHP